MSLTSTLTLHLLLLFSAVGRSKDRRLVTKSPIYHDKDVNTYISVKPDAQIWPAYSFPSPGQIIWEKDIGNIVNHMEARAKEGHSWRERKNAQCDNNGLAANKITTHARQNSVAMTDGLEYGISRKKMRIDCADEGNGVVRVVSPRDSPSPSTTSTESPRASSQDSPSQVKL